MINSLTYQTETEKLLARDYPEMLKNFTDALGVSIVNAIIGGYPTDKKNAHKKKQWFIKSIFKKTKQILTFPTLKDGKINWDETKKVQL